MPACIFREENQRLGDTPETIMKLLPSGTTPSNPGRIRKKINVVLPCGLKTAFICGVVLRCCHANAVAQDRQFQVSGTMSETYYDMQGNPSPRNPYRFNARVSDRCWEITILPKDEDFTTVTFDGTNLYFFQDQEKGVAQLKASGKPIAPNKGTGKVAQKEVPHDFFCRGTGKIWLAYASADYFSHATNGAQLEVPYWETMTVPLRFEQTVKRRTTWEAGDQEVMPPSKATYYEDNNTLKNADFYVNDFQTFNGLKLARQATFDIYYESITVPVKSANPLLRFRYVITAEKFAKLTEPLVFPPSIPVFTSVFDYRFDPLTDKLSTQIYQTDRRFLTKAEVAELPGNQKINYGALPGSFVKHASTGSASHQGLAKWLALAFVVLNSIFLVRYFTTRTRN